MLYLIIQSSDYDRHEGVGRGGCRELSAADEDSAIDNGGHVSLGLLDETAGPQVGLLQLAALAGLRRRGRKW